ncbi:TVP38/TMEM64 family protein [Corynebacterium epidermidicanis]|nr:TVP38/TMEM64 family protein [Corynebacterium epidermidicanis]
MTRTKKFIALGVLVLIGVLVVALVDIESPAQLRQFFEKFGVWSWLAFFFAYVVLTQFPVPRTTFTVAAGVLFGPILGSALALSATTISAALSLTMLRALLADPQEVAQPHDSWLQQMASKQRDHPAFARINTRLEQRGGIAVFFLRMIAGIPFSVLNYACVLTPIPLRSFVVATFFGSAPSTIAGVVLGDALTGSHDTRMLWVFAVLLVVGLSGLFIDFLLPVKPKA